MTEEVKLTNTEITDEERLALAKEAKRSTELDFERVKLANPSDPRLPEFKTKHEAIKDEIKALEKKPKPRSRSKGS